MLYSKEFFLNVHVSLSDAADVMKAYHTAFDSFHSFSYNRSGFSVFICVAGLHA